MPVIVIGADTPIGLKIAEGLVDPPREVRAFVTDEAIGAELKRRGLKVALGDVSDESHVEAAAMRCFSAVLVTEAADDERERSFADSSDAVAEAWARAVSEAGVQRAIWVTREEPPETDVAEVAVVDIAATDVVDRVVALDDAQKIS